MQKAVGSNPIIRSPKPLGTGGFFCAHRVSHAFRWLESASPPMRRAEGATKGREVPCPEDACLFWERGGQAFAGRDSAAHGSASAASEGRERDDR